MCTEYPCVYLFTKNKNGCLETYLVDVVFLNECNHSTVSQAVVKTLQEFDVNYDDVILFNTDNAQYMKKAYKSVLSTLFVNSQHVTCLTHIMNLVAEQFRKSFTSVHQFMLLWSKIFFQAGS